MSVSNGSSSTEVLANSSLGPNRMAWQMASSVPPMILPFSLYLRSGCGSRPLKKRRDPEVPFAGIAGIRDEVDKRLLLLFKALGGASVAELV